MPESRLQFIDFLRFQLTTRVDFNRLVATDRAKRAETGPSLRLRTTNAKAEEADIQTIAKAGILATVRKAALSL